MSCRLSRIDPATQPGGVTGPALASCAGPRFYPLVIGYLRVWPSDLPGHADASTAQLRAFAYLRGLTLAHVYTEQVGVSSRDRAAFRALVEALRHPYINTVIIPTPEYFSRFDGTTIAMETDADIVIMPAERVR